MADRADIAERDATPSPAAGSAAGSEASGSSRRWRRAALAMRREALAVAAVAGPLVLYVLTMPRRITLEDDGWFVIAGKFLGVGHPPGYPVHTLLSNLMLKLPWGTEALLGHLLSAILGALACGAVYACARLLGAGAIAALIGSWLFAASEHFWAQAIITEVYTLNALCFFSVLALLLYLRRDPSARWAWAAAGVLTGIALANHWPLMLLAAPGLLLAALPLWHNPVTRWCRAGAAVLGGIGLAFLQPLLVLTALVLAVLPVWSSQPGRSGRPDRSGRSGRNSRASRAWLTFLPALVLPYAWLVARSAQEPEFNFPGRLDNWGDFWAQILRRSFADVDSSPSADWSDKIEFFSWFVGDALWQITLPGLVLAAIGLVVVVGRFWQSDDAAPAGQRERRGGGTQRVPEAPAGSGASPMSRLWCFMNSQRVLEALARFATPAAFAGSSVVLMWRLDFDYDFLHVQVLRAYPLVCYGLMGIWAAVGLHWVTGFVSARLRSGESEPDSTSTRSQRGERTERSEPVAGPAQPAAAGRRSAGQIAVSAAAAVAGVALVAWTVWSHWEVNNRSQSDFTERYADMIFDVLPPDAVLLTVGDEITLPLAHYYFVEQRRPDVRLAEMHGLAFPTNLFPPRNHMKTALQQEVLREFLAETERPVFQTYREFSVDHGRVVRDYGFVREVLDGEVAESRIELSPHETAEAYFASLFEREYPNGWEQVARNNQVFDYSQFLGYVLFSDVPELIERTAPMRELAETDFYGLTGMASVLAIYGNAEHLELAVDMLERAEKQSHTAVTKLTETALFNLTGTAKWQQGHSDEAKALFEQSRDHFPNPENPAIDYLQQIAEIERQEAQQTEALQPEALQPDG